VAARRQLTLDGGPILCAGMRAVEHNVEREPDHRDPAVRGGRSNPGDRVPAQSITKAKELLDSVAGKVQQYAAQGGLEGSEFKGDTAMKNDAATMDALGTADSLLNPGLLDPSVDPMPFFYGP
jgi:hypothetical protein